MKRLLLCLIALGGCDHKNSAHGMDCTQVTGNVLYLDGDPTEFIYQGKLTITDGDFQVSTQQEPPNYLTIGVLPTDMSQGDWELTFSTRQLNAPLMVGSYMLAERAPFEEAGHAGLDVSGDGRGCNMSLSDFDITTMTLTNNVLTSFTADFVQHCEGNSVELRGCVHVEQH